MQCDVVWEDKPANHARIEQLIEEASIPRGALVVLPEMSDTGFSFALDRTADGRTLPWACAVAARFGMWIGAGWSRMGKDGRGRNCYSIIRPDGTVAGTAEKLHPFSFGREGELFSGGDDLLVVDVNGLKICPLICYDLRFPEAFRAATAAGATCFLVPANWPSARTGHWRTLLAARAIENQAYVVGVNRVGRDPSLHYHGASMIIGPAGEILADADDTPQVLRADLDAEKVTAWRATFPALRDMRSDLTLRMAVRTGGSPRSA